MFHAGAWERDNTQQKGFNQMKYPYMLFACICLLITSSSINTYAQSSAKPTIHKPKQTFNLVKNSDIATAVKVAAMKDCGCTECASKGCAPCKGKNCFYCVAKGLTTKECGCGTCDPKGCTTCGAGCDVCKFHLKPLEEAKKKPK